MIMREVVNGPDVLLSTGVSGRAIPNDLPPRRSVYGLLRASVDIMGTWERIHHVLMSSVANESGREAVRPQPSSTAESESAEKGGRALIRTGYDGGQEATNRRRALRSKGKKRHILVRHIRLLLHAMFIRADIQDRDGGVSYGDTVGKFPFLKRCSPKRISRTEICEIAC